MARPGCQGSPRLSALPPAGGERRGREKKKDKREGKRREGTPPSPPRSSVLREPAAGSPEPAAGEGWAARAACRCGVPAAPEAGCFSVPVPLVLRGVPAVFTLWKNGNYALGHAEIFGNREVRLERLFLSAD